jgi:large subunit ribosomal protein L25
MHMKKIAAQDRKSVGKGPARRLRAQGLIPATIYGPGVVAHSLTVDPKALLDVLSSDLGRNSVIELEVEEQSKQTVLLSDFQYHPVTRKLLHADFFTIDVNSPVDIDVPFELVGKSKGVVLGGTLRQIFRKLPVRCLPEKIPVKIQHDVTEIDIDEHVAVKDLSLPAEVTVRLDPERTVAAVVTETKRGTEEEEAAAAAAPGAAAAQTPAVTPEKT